MDIPNAGQAVQYLRRSVERDKGADKDRGAGQRAANAAQAAADGVTITRTFDGDWGTSGGRGHRDERSAMADLIAAVRAGEVSRIYCHTTDRLARDVEYGMALWNACKDRGTILRPGSQAFDPRDPGYLTLWVVLLAQAEEDLDRMAHKSADTIAYLRDHATTCLLPGRPHRGRCHTIGCTDTTHCGFAHRHGQAAYGERPGEDPANVAAAYREAGTVIGAARLLNARRVPTRLGRPWGTVTVREILIRTGAMQRSTRPGAKSRAPFVLYGLLRCPPPCGHILTGTRYRNGPQALYTAYKCYMARTVPDHGPGSVPERAILPWVRAEVERLRLPVDAVQLATDNAERRAALAGRLERANEMYVIGPTQGGWTRERRDREVAAVAKEITTLDATETIIGVEPIRAAEWDTWTPADLNSYIRAILERVELGPDMRPVRALWRNPELRG